MSFYADWEVAQGDERAMFSHTPPKDVVARHVLEREMVIREHNQAAAQMAFDMRERELQAVYPPGVHNEAELDDYLLYMSYQALRCPGGCHGQ